jgi:cytochrome c oxidase cbb3-type subunit 3
MPQPAALGSTAPPPASKMREIEASPEAVAQGKALFGACIGCHDQDASGRVGIGPRIASESYLQAASDRFLLDTITKGRAGTTMVPWGASFKPDQIQGLVAYLRSIHPTEPAQLDESELKGDPAEGEKIFSTICSGCHGNFGGGYQETANGTGIGRKAFLDTATNGFIRHVVKHGKTLTQMKGFAEESRTAVANLTDTEIDSTIAYLRKNAW